MFQWFQISSCYCASMNGCLLLKYNAYKKSFLLNSPQHLQSQYKHHPLLLKKYLWQSNYILWAREKKSKLSILKLPLSFPPLFLGVSSWANLIFFLDVTVPWPDFFFSAKKFQKGRKFHDFRGTDPLQAVQCKLIEAKRCKMSAEI